jgi:hypothetical protein
MSDSTSRVAGDQEVKVPRWGSAGSGVVESPTVYLLISAHTPRLANSPALDDGRQRLTLIQRLWIELQASRKDPVKYEALAERIRREADAFLQTFRARDPKP